TKYQLLVLDIGNAIDQLFSVLEACNRIYMPVLEDWFSQCKLQQFREMADSVSDCLRDNILELHLPIAPWTEKSPDFPQDLLWGKWGTAVRKILEGFFTWKKHLICFAAFGQISHKSWKIPGIFPMKKLWK